MRCLGGGCTHPRGVNQTQRTAKDRAGYIQNNGDEASSDSEILWALRMDGGRAMLRACAPRWCWLRARTAASASA